MSKLIIHFRNKSIEWHVIKSNALRDQQRKVWERQLEKLFENSKMHVVGGCAHLFSLVVS